MIYDDVKKGLRTSFIHIENARNAINLRKDLERAKTEFKTAYQEIFQLMEMLKRAKSMYPELEAAYKNLLILHDKTLFDAIREIGEISDTDLAAICQIIESTLTKEIINMDKLKKKKAAA
jgi:hypothetical protein